MNISKSWSSIFILIAFIFSGCQSSDTSASSGEQKLTSEKPIDVSESPMTNEKASVSEETKAMVSELSDLVKNGDPTKYYHWNNRRAEIAKAEMLQAPSGRYLSKFLTYVEENLNAGNSSQVIIDIEEYLKSNNISLVPYMSSYKPLYDLLALAYLRDGEQQNCISNHTPYSCLLPLREEGQHNIKSGSQGAIKILDVLTDNHHGDLQSRWLLNLAHMTLGSHPEAVVASKVLELPYDIKFPRFKEISMSVSVAQNGLSGGVCVDDFNGDGFLDIFCTSFGMSDQAHYLENDKAGGFTDRTKYSGIEGIVGGLNTIHADYDGDGDKDILILRGGWLGEGGTHPNSLLRNNGNGSFNDVTYSSGLTSKLPCQTASFFDYDLDGDLDLFFGNEGTSTHPAASELFQNNGDGTFIERSHEAGIDVNTLVKGVTVGDYNNDGYPDLYISVMGGNNFLFENNRDGTFKDVTQNSGVAEPYYSFPTWFFDVNNDGWEDLFVGSYDLGKQDFASFDFAAELINKASSEEKPRLFINQKDGSFLDGSEQYGVRKSMYAMGSNYGDLDNDGYLDFYIGTGTPSFSSVVPNRMFRNKRGKEFEEVTYAGGFGHVQKGHAIAFGDLNNDGDQEVYAVMGGALEGDTFTNVLFEGKPNDNRWITLNLKGDGGNIDAVGARVSIVTSNMTIHRTVSTGGSFGSDPMRVEVGLGQCEPNVSIKVVWPDVQRSVTSLEMVATDRHYIILKEKNSIEELDISPYKFNVGVGHHHHHH